MKCKLIGKKKKETIFEVEYPSRGWAYASATSAVIGLSNSVNPQKITHIEIWESGRYDTPRKRLWKDDKSLIVMKCMCLQK